MKTTRRRHRIVCLIDPSFTFSDPGSNRVYNPLSKEGPDVLLRRAGPGHEGCKPKP